MILQDVVTKSNRSTLPLFAVTVGLLMGPPFDLVHCLAVYWHEGMDSLDVLHASTRCRANVNASLAERASVSVSA